MDYCKTRRLRSSRSDHSLAQEARIDALLKEMRPNLSTSRPLRVSEDDISPSPPTYEVIFSPKIAPPPYNQLFLRSAQSTWIMDQDAVSVPRPKMLSTWSVNPATLTNACATPTPYVSSTINMYGTVSPEPPLRNGYTRAEMNQNIVNGNDLTSTFSLPDSSFEKSALTPRNAPRQASFMAAMTRQSLGENENDEEPSTAMRCCIQEQSTPQVFRRLDPPDKGVGGNSTAKENRRTTIYGDKIFSKQPRHESHRDMNHNVSAQNKMRRARPKSYVLATSTSLPETEHPMAFSHDDSRELSSLGSLSSIDRNNAANAQHAHAHGHRMQKFISLFSHQHSPVKMRAKRSRTSLPLSRTPLPDTILRANKLIRQGWLRHQELALGKTGKRRHWDECYAVLFDRSLYLCPNEPRTTIAETSGEKLVHLPPCARVDVHSSIIDIAYEWLAMSHTKHVIRLVTQTRTEHLFELNNEADMLSWISTLQSCAEGTMSPQLHSSCSAASLASSSSTPSERNGHTVSATSQLIMHRYKAKSSQLQSPVSSKRSIANDVHCVQPGTSKDSSSGENGEPSTPKSGRKWKKTKAGKVSSGGTASGPGSGSSSAATNATSSASGMATPQSVLGVRLADCATGGPDDLVPLLVQICVSVVEANGLDTIGIYRIPGNTAAVNALKETLSQHLDTMTLENLDVSDPRWRDVNVVSSLLKMFLRKLPEPLLTDKLYPFFIDANRIASHPNRLHKLRNLLRKLPRHHYATLKYIIYHLSEITKNSHVNKMETRNLALMFGPSIVRPSDDNMATMVTHMSDQCKIIETLIHYHEWMFNDSSPADDAVPEQHPSETGGPPIEAPQYGVGVPTGVSAASFNDMHNLIRKANEDQAAAMMAEGKGGKIKNILRRNSRRDKSKSKLKIESTAPAAMNPRGAATPTANHTVAHHTAPHPVTHSPTTQSSVDSAFCGNYQERDIDAEIMSRQTVSPLAAAPSSNLEESPSVESSIGSIPDTSRTDPGTTTTTSSTVESGEVQARRKRQQDIYSARRIFIAGSAAAADDASAVDDLANHTHHLNIANTPALEVLSEETREKIRKMQRRQNWMDPLPFTFPSHLASTSHPTPTAPPPAQPEPSPPTAIAFEGPKNNSPTKDMTDALSCTSDYSTTSSAPLTAPLAVACAASSSDYASSFSDPSPCARNASASPRQRPQVLGVLPEARCQQKIRIRSRTGPRDPTRRHTLSDMDVLKEGRLEKFARWFGIRKSSPDVSAERAPLEEIQTRKVPFDPPVIVRTSPNELTPASGDEQL